MQASYPEVLKLDFYQYQIYPFLFLKKDCIMAVYTYDCLMISQHNSVLDTLGQQL